MNGRDQPPGDPGTLAGLTADLRHRRAAVRARAADHLGELGLEEAIGPLVKAASDARREVRRAALCALWRLDPQAFADTAVALAETVGRDELFADIDAAFARATEGPTREP